MSHISTLVQRLTKQQKELNEVGTWCIAILGDIAAIKEHLKKKAEWMYEKCGDLEYKERELKQKHQKCDEQYKKKEAQHMHEKQMDMHYKEKEAQHKCQKCADPQYKQM